jgi:beta-lactamase superfamily II metal-dependent hydrolase
MIIRIFDVDQGSCCFIRTQTGRTELVDFGGKFNWSPVDHIYRNYVDYGATIDRLVLTHHHGDHLKDLRSFGDRRPHLVLRRILEGGYLAACRRSNTYAGQQLAEEFSRIYDSWAGEAPAWATNAEAWGVTIEPYMLQFQDAERVSSTDNSLVNNCSLVRLYNHGGTKILLCGDLEKEGMALLLAQNPSFRSVLSGVHVLVAPHHGHRTGFSTELFEATGQVQIVIASMMSGDAYVDTRYSDDHYVRGIPFDDGTTKRLLTTRTHGSITVESFGGGGFHVTINQR